MRGEARPATVAASFLDAAGDEHALARVVDPRAKVAMAFLFSLLMAVCHGRPVALLGMALGLVTAGLAGAGPVRLLKRMAAVNAFALFLWLTLPLRLTPVEAFPWLRPVFDPAGLDLALTLTLKINAVLLAMTGLLGSSSVGELLHALAHFRLPRRLMTLFFLFHRYLFVIHAEYARLREAMAARCFRPRTDLRTYRAYANLLGMLLARSVDRAERVHHAMLCRGFDGTFWLLDHFAWKRADTAFCAFYGLLLAGLAAVEWLGPAGWWGH